MTHKALSDDESDHENGSNLGQSRYAIVKEEWRSDEFIIWLRMLDLLACGEKWKARLVAPVGNGRRLRVHSTRSKPGNAVAGLPENCYDPNWLKSLNSMDRKLLNVKPAFDMTFTSTERSCAFYRTLQQSLSDAQPSVQVCSAIYPTREREHPALDEPSG